MKYSVRPGIVMTTVCDENLLVSTGEARGKTPYVKSLNSTGAWFWRQFEKIGESEQIISTAMAEYDIPEETARSAFNSFAATLLKEGYIFEE